MRDQFERTMPIGTERADQFEKTSRVPAMPKKALERISNEEFAQPEIDFLLKKINLDVFEQELVNNPNQDVEITAKFLAPVLRELQKAAPLVEFDRADVAERFIDVLQRRRATTNDEKLTSVINGLVDYVIEKRRPKARGDDGHAPTSAAA